MGWSVLFPRTGEGADRIGVQHWHDGNTDPEELSVAAPIRDHRQTVVAAVLLSVPRSRSTPFLVEDYTRRACEAAASVSSRLGASPGSR